LNLRNTHSRFQTKKDVSRNIPTYAKNRQYNAANIGAGIEAKTAPNFPRMEKKIMKPAEI